MPDAYGNLLNLGEFTTGRKVRFISYMGGGDFALGFYGYDPDGYHGEVALRNLSYDGIQLGWAWSVMTLEQQPGGGTFRCAGQDFDGNKRYLCMVTLAGTSDIVMCHLSEAQAAKQEHGDVVMDFTVDMVDSVWFAFNNHDRTRVVDVQGASSASEEAPMIGWTWNDGDNQKWRACLVED